LIDRYRAIAAPAAKLRARSFSLDGEAAVSGADERKTKLARLLAGSSAGARSS
jgi:hypothetical protein